MTQVNTKLVFDKSQDMATHYLAATRMLWEKARDLQVLAYVAPAFGCTDIIYIPIQNHPAAFRCIVCCHCYGRLVSEPARYTAFKSSKWYSLITTPAEGRNQAR